jgi:hypothetical protein
MKSTNVTAGKTAVKEVAKKGFDLERHEREALEERYLITA